MLKLLEYPFSIFRCEAVSVNKYGFTVIDTNRYGLSPVLFDCERRECGVL